MDPLRAAVIGAGHYGRLHARKYAAMADVRLMAVVDKHAGRAAQVAAETGARAYTDHRAVLDDVDVVSVAVPASAHFAVGRDLLEAGIHVLMEKPIATSLTEGTALAELATARGCVLRIGHLERFNPVVQALSERAETPFVMRAHRLAPPTGRGTDVDVVLDLMIHDIDLALMLAGAPLTGIEALRVVPDQADVANARLQFANGCVAVLTASRISIRRQRRLRVFQAGDCLSADLSRHVLDRYRMCPHQSTAKVPRIEDRCVLAPGDPLHAEIRAILTSVRTGSSLPVTAEEGVRALAAALEVVRQLGRRPLPGQPLRLAPGRAQP